MLSWQEALERSSSSVGWPWCFEGTLYCWDSPIFLLPPSQGHFEEEDHPLPHNHFFPSSPYGTPFFHMLIYHAEP